MKEQKNKKEQQNLDTFRSAKVSSAVFQNAIPAMIAMLMVLIYNVADTRKVAEYVCILAEYIAKKHAAGECEEDFNEERKEKLFLAALLHDIGKMIIPLKIMNRSNRLDEDISAFSLKSSRSAEMDLGEFSDTEVLNSVLREYQDETPVKATLSDHITNASTAIQITKGNVLTLDLDGYSISSASTIVSMEGGDLTVNGGEITADTSGEAYAVRVSSGSFTLKKGSVTGKGGQNGGTALFVDGGSADVSGGSLIGESTTVSFGCYATSNSTLIITGGTFIRDSVYGKGLYIDQNVEAVVSGGSYSGGIGINIGAVPIHPYSVDGQTPSMISLARVSCRMIPFIKRERSSIQTLQLKLRMVHGIIPARKREI